jgi:hypothetical protein
MKENEMERACSMKEIVNAYKMSGRLGKQTTSKT